MNRVSSIQQQCPVPAGRPRTRIVEAFFAVWVVLLAGAGWSLAHQDYSSRWDAELIDPAILAIPLVAFPFNIVHP
jgi:hypothetical protein